MVLSLVGCSSGRVISIKTCRSMVSRSCGIAAVCEPSRHLNVRCMTAVGTASSSAPQISHKSTAIPTKPRAFDMSTIVMEIDKCTTISDVGKWLKTRGLGIFTPRKSVKEPHELTDFLWQNRGMVLCLVIARAGALYRAGFTPDDDALKEDTFQKGFQLLTALLSSPAISPPLPSSPLLSSKGTPLPSPLLSSPLSSPLPSPFLDPRVLCSTLYALSRLLPRHRQPLLFDALTRKLSSPGAAKPDFALLRSADMTPRALAMCVYAFAQHGVQYETLPTLYNLVSHLIQHPPWPLNAQSSVGAIDPSELAMILAAFSRANVTAAKSLNVVLQGLQPTLDSCSQSTIVSICKSAANINARMGARISSIAPTFWTALTDELAVRAHLWSQMAPRPRSEKTERDTPFSPQGISTTLHSLASSGIRAPHVFSGAVKYLSSVSVSSGTDSGGEHGFRAAETAVTGSAPGDVAVISTYGTAAIAGIMWSLARSSYRSPQADALWDASKVTMMARLGSALQKNSRRFDPLHTASFAWAATRSSVPVRDFLHLALKHASAERYPVTALAQLLWACAVQEVYDKELFITALRQIPAAAASAGYKYLVQPPPNWGSIPSSEARLATQLYYASISASVESGLDLQRDVGFTQELLQSWRNCYAASRPSPSRLQLDVSRFVHHQYPARGQPTVLDEYVTKEGLIVDVFLPEQNKVCEIQGPTHYILPPDYSADAPLGHQVLVTHPSPTLSTLSKLRLLRKCGYDVVCISWWEWHALQSSEEKTELLERLGIGSNLTHVGRV